MKTDELRAKYLDFFQSKGHTVCASDVMVPKWDKSVLFTPAGMNQFKDHFLGKVELEFTRATTSQKCLRTGDIENVGRTAYHHTFFEMLGNFSFGDYFKREAIHWAWEFLTDPKWLGFDKERLSVTVYLDDDEASRIWNEEIGLPLSRIERLGEHDNFWPADSPSLGPDGVCGPCSEIFFHPDDGPECEIWNLVFTQFNRDGDPPNNLTPLPSKNIDTGMGLERTAAVLQGVSTNFHIDTLMPIVQAAAEVCGVKYIAESDNGRRLRRITDHIRACSLAIHENVYPGAQKEESVVRLLLRRAVLQGYDMGLRDPFLFKLVPAVVEQLGNPYPELRETVDRVAAVVQGEEQSFYGVIERGIPRVEKMVKDAMAQGTAKLDAREIAAAFQTHGVPPSVAESVAERHGLTFDWQEFEQAMAEHGEISNTGEKTVMGDSGPLDDIKREVKSTTFLGYETTEAKSEICGMFVETSITGSEASKLVSDRAQTMSVIETAPGKEVVQFVVLRETPFYAESGGQVGDTGSLTGPRGKFTVTDTQKDGDVFVHRGFVSEGSLSVGEQVVAAVDSMRRTAICRAHSATHILHYALQQNLGTHAQQRGSKVSDDLLRFDFANMDAVTEEQLAAIEQETHRRIDEAVEITAAILPLESAREQGAMMLFGEKYPDPVRMVSIGEFSKELCGGIHLENSREVEAFEIFSEENMGAGTRRIQAWTGQKAKENQQKIQQGADKIARLLKVSMTDIPEAVAAVSQQVRGLKKQLNSGVAGDPAITNPPAVAQTAEPAVPNYFEVRAAMRRTALGLNIPVLDVPARVEAMLGEIKNLQTQIAQLGSAADIDLDELIANAETVGSVRLIAQHLPGANVGLMRQLIDGLRKKTDSLAIFFITSPAPEKVLLLNGLSRDLVDGGLHAGKWIAAAAEVVGGRGGGKPDMAQAGGKDASKLDESLAAAKEYIRTAQSS